MTRRACPPCWRPCAPGRTWRSAAARCPAATPPAWPARGGTAVSTSGTRLAQRALPVRLRDPMSGYFLLRRPLFERLAPRLTAQGFKILLDLVLSAPAPLRVVEVPCPSTPARPGAASWTCWCSRSSPRCCWTRRRGALLPLRFVSFALVGAVGVAIHLAVLTAARRAGAPFEAAQVVATLVAMVANFQLNNAITYRDQRLRGPALVARAGAVPDRVRPRRLRQYRHRPGALLGPCRLDPGRPRGRGDRAGVELRGLGDAGVARALTALAVLTALRLAGGGRGAAVGRRGLLLGVVPRAGAGLPGPSADGGAVDPGGDGAGRAGGVRHPAAGAAGGGARLRAAGAGGGGPVPRAPAGRAGGRAAQRHAAAGRGGGDDDAGHAAAAVLDGGAVGAGPAARHGAGRLVAGGGRAGRGGAGQQVHRGAARRSGSRCGWSATPEGRRWLRTPWPWAGGALAALCFAPVLWWNAGHGWASFAKQGGRTGDWRPADALRHVAELLGSQLGLGTPGVAVLCAAGIGWRRGGGGRAAPALLAALTVPGALVFLQHALGDRVQANWPAILFPAACIAAAAYAPRFWRPAAGLGFAIAAVVYLQAATAVLPLPRGLDPTLIRLGGWDGLAQDVRARGRRVRGRGQLRAGGDLGPRPARPGRGRRAALGAVPPPRRRGRGAGPACSCAAGAGPGRRTRRPGRPSSRQAARCAAVTGRSPRNTICTA